jgi:hypothetical protein
MRETPEELRVVVVDGEDEAQPLEALVAVSSEDESSVDELLRRCDLGAAADPQGGRERPVADVTGRIVRVTDAQREGVRPNRPNDALHRKLTHGAAS